MAAASASPPTPAPTQPALPALPVLSAPTASGKSALALRLARERGLDVISADAFTVYRGLDIGTAKPGPSERAQVPHHLLDVVDVTERYDVAQWVAAVEQLAADLLAQGRRPLVVGGTGFYLRALARGLPLAPPADPAQRAATEHELAERGLDALLDEIAQVRPDQLARMERNPRRVVRALEVYRRTGRFPSDFGWRRPRFAVQLFAYSPPPGELDARITRRTEQMLDAGWAAEAQWLAERVPPDTRPPSLSRPTVWQALGYREALALARGELTRAQALDAIAGATRRYAKRQRTFLRTQLDAELLTPAEAERSMEGWLDAAGWSPVFGTAPG